jgi:peptidoglycan LD-endopeptidase LytH
MSKWLLSFILLTTSFFTFDFLRPVIENTVEGFAKTVTHSFNLARLSTKPVDDVLWMPVQGARVSRVADTWQAPRPGGRLHKGQDIFARRGTPVRSATAGVITDLADGGLGGKTIWISGAGWRTYYYAHLDRHAPDLRIGEYVTADTVIGYVGNTGNARTTPPHLHFGVYAMAGAVNPLPLLRDRITLL